MMLANLNKALSCNDIKTLLHVIHVCLSDMTVNLLVKIRLFQRIFGILPPLLLKLWVVTSPFVTQERPQISYAPLVYG